MGEGSERSFLCGGPFSRLLSAASMERLRLRQRVDPGLSGSGVDPSRRPPQPSGPPRKSSPFPRRCRLVLRVQVGQVPSNRETHCPAGSNRGYQESSSGFLHCRGRVTTPTSIVHEAEFFFSRMYSSRTWVCPRMINVVDGDIEKEGDTMRSCSLD